MTLLLLLVFFYIHNNHFKTRRLRMLSCLYLYQSSILEDNVSVILYSILDVLFYLLGFYS